MRIPKERDRISYRLVEADLGVTPSWESLSTEKEPEARPCTRGRIGLHF